MKYYVSEHKAKWELYLSLVEYAYNNIVHSSIGKDPFEIVEGAREVPSILHTKEKIFEVDRYVEDLRTAPQAGFRKKHFENRSLNLLKIDHMVSLVSLTKKPPWTIKMQLLPCQPVPSSVCNFSACPGYLVPFLFTNQATYFHLNSISLSFCAVLEPLT